MHWIKRQYLNGHMTELLNRYCTLVRMATKGSVIIWTFCNKNYRKYRGVSKGGHVPQAPNLGGADFEKKLKYKEFFTKKHILLQFLETFSQKSELFYFHIFSIANMGGGAKLILAPGAIYPRYASEEVKGFFAWWFQLKAYSAKTFAILHCAKSPLIAAKFKSIFLGASGLGCEGKKIKVLDSYNLIHLAYSHYMTRIEKKFNLLRVIKLHLIEKLEMWSRLSRINEQWINLIFQDTFCHNAAINIR